MAFDAVGYLNCSWRICQSNGQSCITLWITCRGRIIFQWKSPVSSCVRDQWFSLERSLWYIIVCQSHRSHNKVRWHCVEKYFNKLITFFFGDLNVEKFYQFLIFWIMNIPRNSLLFRASLINNFLNKITRKKEKESYNLKFYW